MKRFITVLISILLITACGGGGGGNNDGDNNDGDNNGNDYGNELLIITTDNMEEVASTTLSAVTDITGIGTSFTRISATSSDSPYHSISSRDLLKRQLEQVRELLTGKIGQQLSAQAVPAATENCDNSGGTLDVTYHDADNNGKLSVGDRFDFHYQNCRDNALGITTNGRITLRVAEVVGDVVNEIPPYTFGGRLDIDELNIIDNRNGDSSTSNGDINFKLNTDDNVVFNFKFSGNAITDTQGSTTNTLRNYQLMQTENDATGDYLIWGNGDVQGTGIGGTVNFQITDGQPLRGVGDDYPSSGTVNITGKASRLLVTAVDSTRVQLALDSNDDGITDSSQEFTWAELLGD